MRNEVILAHPTRYALLSAYRFLMQWFDWGVREAYGGHDTRSFELGVAQQALLLAAAVIGACVSWRRGWPLALSVVSVSLLYMAIVGRERYSVPTMPLVVALAAIGCTWLGRRLRQSALARGVPKAGTLRDA